jgi:hypothetical protein
MRVASVGRQPQHLQVPALLEPLAAVARHMPTRRALHSGRRGTLLR